jgi:uncharacterized protein YjiS (DUF1127 family)
MHIPQRSSLRAMPDLAAPIHDGRRTAWPLRLARRLQHQFLRWHRTRAAAAELAAMSDRRLADIGVSRSEISRIVRRGRDA